MLGNHKKLRWWLKGPPSKQKADGGDGGRRCLRCWSGSRGGNETETDRDRDKQRQRQTETERGRERTDDGLVEDDDDMDFHRAAIYGQKDYGPIEPERQT